ncbi:MAG TPA: type II toxin-antitoxin system CcdA family antitoxin [Stellaceae bacterium]|nr:type II toxin-antitoxin system CcdA family antitoxin [Stellaceae bacterium]
MSAHPGSPASSGQKRPTNISLPSDLVDEARALGVSLSAACERGLAEAVAAERAQRWLAENSEALHSSNDYVEREGLPLARYRRF